MFIAVRREEVIWPILVMVLLCALLLRLHQDGVVSIHSMSNLGSKEKVTSYSHYFR
jgi:hypothetical protein